MHLLLCSLWGGRLASVMIVLGRRWRMSKNLILNYLRGKVKGRPVKRMLVFPQAVVAVKRRNARQGIPRGGMYSALQSRIKRLVDVLGQFME